MNLEIKNLFVHVPSGCLSKYDFSPLNSYVEYEDYRMKIVILEDDNEKQTK